MTLDPKRLEAALSQFNRAYGKKPQRLRGAGEALSEEAVHVLMGWQKESTVAIITAYLEAGDWKPIETAPKGRVVLVAYQNTLGNWRTVRACYYPPETLDNESEESGWAPEGWYEEYEAYEHIYRTAEEPTHWQPLPQPPEKGEVS